MVYEYLEKIVIFKETPEGLVADMAWLHEAGEEGWELAGTIPLIAPNRDGIAYGTVGSHMILKRPKKVL
jgi:hypothetical protein